MRSRIFALGPLVVAIPLIVLGCGGCGKTVPTETGKSLPKIDLEPADLSGRGATFVTPIMDVWTHDFSEKTSKKVKLNYTGTGSGDGVSQMTKKLADFGCSDNPMTKKQMEEVPAGETVIHVPTVVGAVVPAYNLPGINEPLKFTGPLLVEIFTGKIKKWNDGKIAAVNPGVTLPDLAIQPVFRADPSGTTFIFADYLAKVDANFAKSAGVSNLPKWPEGVGIKQPKSDGVAGHISKNPGTIGYIELTYALDSKDQMKFGSVRNKAGKDVLADFDSIAAAAEASIGLPQSQEPYSLHELTYNLTDAPGEKSYPIAGMSFAVLYKKQSGAKGKALVEFLKWATGPEGQDLAKARNYAPLPPALREKIAKRLEVVEIQ